MGISGQGHSALPASEHKLDCDRARERLYSVVMTPDTNSFYLPLDVRVWPRARDKGPVCVEKL